MPRGILSLHRDGETRYVEWSTVVDAPVTYAMTEDELRAHMKEEYGNEGLRELPERMKRVAATGTSFRDTTADEVTSGNRAGPDETTLTMDELVATYWTAPETP